MAENETIMNEETTPEFDPIEEIKKLKENSVSKDEYNKLKAENGKLMKTLIEGGQIEKTEPKKNIEEMRKALYTQDCNLNNLDYIKTVLDLRDAIMSDGGEDPFLPNGRGVAITMADRDSATHLAEVLKECVESADGDSERFTMELQRSMRDVRY